MNMSILRRASLVTALLFVTAYRLPAPIHEIPETPSPTPAVAPAAESKPPPKVPAATPKLESTKAPVKAEEKPAGVSVNTAPARKATKETQSTDGNIIPKGAVHLVIHNQSDARKIFTYFRLPGVEAPTGTIGLYRIEVNPDGAVAAVTILKSMGSDQDIAYMKAFVRWRAVPGPLRVVDISPRIVEFNRVSGH
jgi:outer membrane biosynthesis protein TonB